MLGQVNNSYMITAAVAHEVITAIGNLTSTKHASRVFVSMKLCNIFFLLVNNDRPEISLPYADPQAELSGPSSAKFGSNQLA